MKLRLPLILRRHLCRWMGHSRPISVKVICCPEHDPQTIGHVCFYCLEHLETAA